MLTKKVVAVTERADFPLFHERNSARQRASSARISCLSYFVNQANDYTKQLK